MKKICTFLLFLGLFILLDKNRPFLYKNLSPSSLIAGNKTVNILALRTTREVGTESKILGYSSSGYLVALSLLHEKPNTLINLVVDHASLIELPRYIDKNIPVDSIKVGEKFFISHNLSVLVVDSSWLKTNKIPHADINIWTPIHASSSISFTDLYHFVESFPSKKQIHFQLRQYGYNNKNNKAVSFVSATQKHLHFREIFLGIPPHSFSLYSDPLLFQPLLDKETDVGRIEFLENFFNISSPNIRKEISSSVWNFTPNYEYYPSITANFFFLEELVQTARFKKENQTIFIAEYPHKFTHDKLHLRLLERFGFTPESNSAFQKKNSPIKIFSKKQHKLTHRLIIYDPKYFSSYLPRLLFKFIDGIALVKGDQLFTWALYALQKNSFILNYQPVWESEKKAWEKLLSTDLKIPADTVEKIREDPLGLSPEEENLIKRAFNTIPDLLDHSLPENLLDLSKHLLTYDYEFHSLEDLFSRSA